MNGGLWSLLFLLFLAVTVLLIHIAFVCVLKPINKCTSKVPNLFRKGNISSYANFSLKTGYFWPESFLFVIKHQTNTSNILKV